jgi:hypothetical protein
MKFNVAKENAGQTPDWRHINNGMQLPFNGSYLDQPYLVRADNGTWIMVATCGTGPEGTPGQSVAVSRSRDLGRTWSAPQFLEPADGPEASYGIILKTDFGRIYVFYNHNSDNLREVSADPDYYPGGKCPRVDTQGHFVYRFSDDHGITWSDQRYEVPVRAFEIDRQNPYGGKVRFFWTVGRAFSAGGKGYLPLHKVGGFGNGFITRSEGVLIESDNIHVERDPERLRFATLPEGDIGIRGVAGGGPIAEEHCVCVLSDGSFFVLFRTTDGHNACAYSRDAGRTWNPSQYMRYHDGRLFKHPRAATFVFPHSGGKYFCWFHNHGGRGYKDRRIVWLSVGTETNGEDGVQLTWSEPEILFYSDQLTGSFSYPDMIEGDGRTFFTISHKQFGTFHEVDPEFMRKLTSDAAGDSETPIRADLEVDSSAYSGSMPAEVAWDGFPVVNHRTDWWEDIFTRDLRSGFTIELGIDLCSPDPEAILLDSRNQRGEGVAIFLREGRVLEILLRDELSECRWSSQPGLLEDDGFHHVAVIVDGGPKIVSFIIDGAFDDGGDHRQFGYGLIHPTLRKLGDSQLLRFPPLMDNLRLQFARIHSRALLTSECRINCLNARNATCT